MLPHAAADPLAGPSAQIIVPKLLDIVAPRSVIDIGCGTGAWLRTFIDHGVTDVLGVDEGPALAASSIPESTRHEHDLRQPLRLPRRFDLVLCLEVAEHLDARAAATLTASIASAGEVVLFSAAIPHQRGPGHVNLQWPGYWTEHFASHGLAAADCFRSVLWQDERIAWWYRQNLYLLASPDVLERLGLPSGSVLPLVHPACLDALAEETRPRTLADRVGRLRARLSAAGR